MIAADDGPAGVAAGAGGAGGDAKSVGSHASSGGTSATAWTKAAEATQKAMPSNMGALSDMTLGTAIAEVCGAPLWRARARSPF